MVTLAADLASALDPVRLAMRAGITPDPWQADVLRSNAPRVLLNCSRQSGKSTISALLGVHQAVYSPGSLVLLLSPSLRQSQELFRRCLHAYRAADRPVPPQAESALRLELENGSRIVSLPATETTIRGLSAVSLLICDEASRIPDSLYLSVRPMLAVSGGRLLALSTPWGTRGWFFESWHSAEPWQRFEVPATKCPRINPEFLEEERRTVGPYWFEQEYLCQFLDAQTSAFRRADVDAAFGDGVEAWDL